jgi:hypothetical protein
MGQRETSGKHGKPLSKEGMMLVVIGATVWSTSAWGMLDRVAVARILKERCRYFLWYIGYLYRVIQNRETKNDKLPHTHATRVGTFCTR